MTTDVPGRLVVQYGRYRDQTYEITHLQITIGRSPSNDITFTDPEISRQHVRFMRQEDGYVIEDLGSTNGTFINKERVNTKTPIYHQDIINLGDAIDLLFLHEPSQRATDESDPSLNEDDLDTPAFSQPPPTILDTPSPLVAAPAPVPPAVASSDESAAYLLEETPSRSRRLIVGCGCSLLILIALCIGLLIFLDSYQQGRLLYCGPIRPLFEAIFGPLGFAPICS